MEQYRFFNSTADDIREYNADDFAEYFERSYKSGVYREDGKLSLRCTNLGTDMKTSVGIGSAMIQGHMYLNIDAPITLTHNTSDSTHDRIDRVVLRLDLNDDKNYIKAFVLEGTPSAEPIAPIVSRDELIFELSLAQVLIKANNSTIPKSNITDERLNKEVCGVVASQLDSKYVNTTDYLMEVVEFDIEDGSPTEVDYTTSEGLLFEKTRLSEKDQNGNYSKLELLQYLEDGVTVGHIKEYILTYNDDNIMTKRELVSKNV